MTTTDGPPIADAYTLLHDPVQAARYMTSSDTSDPPAQGEASILQGYAALDRGDAACAVAPLEAFDKIWLANPIIQASEKDQPCFLGLASGLVGRMAETEAAFKQVATPWSRCYAFHGQVLAHAGDGAGRSASGARACACCQPPNVYLARGRWEMDHDDLTAASADLAAASAKAPHYADPLKAWGDLLAKQGRWKDALAKYDAALKYAPARAELH
jgi:tetratricopeptide (TPR) repeat protein